MEKFDNIVSYNPKAFDSADEKIGSDNQNVNNRDYLYDDDFTFKLGGEIFKKFENFEKECNVVSVNSDVLVKNRSNQLAIAKVLVNIHERHGGLLIQSYAKLGEAYIKHNCHESAFDH